MADEMRRSEQQSHPTRISTRRDFAGELTLARENAGLTIREIATALGLPVSTLGGYFGGAHLPRLSSPCVLERILRVCGINDADHIDQWRQALRQARRVASRHAMPAPLADGTGPADLATSAGSAVAPAELAAAPDAPDGAATLSTRPPVHRLAGEPRVRGRDDLVRLLAAGFDPPVAGPQRSRVHVLHGLGGCGKSTVALALARDAVAHGIRTWWISAADPRGADAGLRAVALELGVGPVGLRLGSTPDQLWRRLDRLREPWLLVIDDADDPLRTLALPGHRIIDATGWLRPISGPYGTVVVTSRDGSTETWDAPRSRWLSLHPVRPLGDRDGAQVLRELAGDAAGSAASSRRLSRRLGGHALALRDAGRFLGETASIPTGIAEGTGPATFDAYRQALDRGGHRDLFGIDDVDAEPGAAAPQHTRRAVIGPTWEVSLDLLEAHGLAEARPLLRLLALLGPGAIAYPQLLRAPVLATSLLLPGLTGRRLWTVLMALAGVGLIELDATAGTHTLALPPLVRDTCRAHRDVGARLPRYLDCVTALLTAAVRDLDPYEPSSWTRWRALAEHCASPLDLIREHRPRPAETPPDVLGPTIAAVRYLRASGHPAQAAARYPDLIAAARRLFGRDHPDVIGLHHDLNRVWYDAGQYNRAKRGLHAILAVRRGLLGPDHPDTLTTGHCLARALREHGQLEAAYAQFADVLDRRRRVLGPDHLDTLLTAAEVAEMLRARGQLDRAEVVLAQVCAVRLARLGPGHPATLIGRLRLARLAADRGEPGRAEAELRELLTALRATIGADHPWTMTGQQSLADACHRLGRLDEAELLAREVLHARHRVLGYDHPATLTSRYRLGAILHDQGDVDSAEKELQAVLEARGQALCPGHPDTERTARRLAELRRARDG